jgi:hypothetical protein
MIAEDRSQYTLRQGDKEMSATNDNWLAEVVEILHSHDVESFLIIAENPKSKRKPGDEFRAAFGGKQSVIVTMLMEVFKSKKDNISFILDAFVALGNLDKTGQQEELEDVLERLKRE